MRETVASFGKRTRTSYVPRKKAGATTLRALGSEESLPTLFRFPGGCGLLDHFLGTASRLAIPAKDSAEIWAAADPKNAEAPGASHFGTIAILQPLRFGFSEERPGIYVGNNRLADPEQLVWVPPSKLSSPIPWDSISTASDASGHLGAIDPERARVIDSLEAYAVELKAIAKAKFPAKERRWCDQPEEQRLAALKKAGIKPSWTGRTSARTGA